MVSEVKPKTKISISGEIILKIQMIKIFLFCFYKIWFEPMFFSGFFCGFEQCGSAAFRIFRGGTSSRRRRRGEALTFPTWCRWSESNRHEILLSMDFESIVSANSTTAAMSHLTIFGPSFQPIRQLKFLLNRLE